VWAGELRAGVAFERAIAAVRVSRVEPWDNAPELCTGGSGSRIAETLGRFLRSGNACQPVQPAIARRKEELLSRFRVDTVPLTLRLPFLVYGYVLGFFWFTYLLLQRASVKVQVTGLENLAADSNYIFCQWHESGPLFLQACIPRLQAVVGQRPHAWMQHPAWYTKPIHVLLALIGVRRPVLGSTGHGGRRAAEELVTYLKEGYSTVIAPDGPSGPARTLKKGVLHMALQSGVPIVPLRISASRYHLRSKSWDLKMQPLPFSTIHVVVGAPMLVTTSTFDETLAALPQALG
jgi:lysophospholipid acyltransferase (LPLAT)-like uncharacterized protein